MINSHINTDLIEEAPESQLKSQNDSELIKEETKVYEEAKSEPDDSASIQNNQRKVLNSLEVLNVE